MSTYQRVPSPTSDWSRYAYSLALTSKAPSYMKDEEYIVRGVPQLNLTDGSVTVQTEVTEARVSGSRAETRRRSPLGSIGWPPRSRSSSEVPNRSLSSSLSVRPEAN